MSPMSRRSFMLRGSLGGVGLTMGLPFLDYFLNDNGTALAATLGGGRLPLRFGTWFWGCGMIPSRWVPAATGAGYDLPPELAPIKDVQQHISVLSGFGVSLDGRSNAAHTSGNTALRTGIPADNWQQIEAPSLDVIVSDTIGAGSFFRSLELSTDGNPRTSYSYRTGSAMNASVPSPLELYQKIFGTDFHDPNAADFKPDPRFMVRRSVLSAFTDERRKLLGRLGATDRARMDQYFTSIREVENKLALQLEKPPRAEACVLPKAPAEISASTDVAARRAANAVMADLLAMALACNQTKVFNMVFSPATSDLREAGSSTAYHQTTHEELVDRSVGYQPTVDRFCTSNMEAWADFVRAMASIKEGGGSLLDNMLILAHSDVSMAKDHAVDGIPMMLAGRAGGKVKSGLHVAASGGDPVSCVGLTIQQIMGVPASSWGTQSMHTTRVVSEVIA